MHYASVIVHALHMRRITFLMSCVFRAPFLISIIKQNMFVYLQVQLRSFTSSALRAAVDV